MMVDPGEALASSLSSHRLKEDYYSHTDLQRFGRSDEADSSRRRVQEQNISLITRKESSLSTSTSSSSSSSSSTTPSSTAPSSCSSTKKYGHVFSEPPQLLNRSHEPTPARQPSLLSGMGSRWRSHFTTIVCSVVVGAMIGWYLAHVYHRRRWRREQRGPFISCIDPGNNLLSLNPSFHRLHLPEKVKSILWTLLQHSSDVNRILELLDRVWEL